MDDRLKWHQPVWLEPCGTVRHAVSVERTPVGLYVQKRCFHTDQCDELWAAVGSASISIVIWSYRLPLAHSLYLFVRFFDNIVSNYFCLFSRLSWRILEWLQCVCEGRLVCHWMTVTWAELWLLRDSDSTSMDTCWACSCSSLCSCDRRLIEETVNCCRSS